MLSRIIYGARTALAVGFLSSLIGSTLGAIIGVASAYFGGRTDMIIQRFMDIILSFPIIVLALAVVAVLGKNVVFGIDWNLIIAIGLPMVPKVARVVRSSALAVREMPYIDAARTAGFSHSAHHLPAHRAQRGRALPHHAHRVRRRRPSCWRLRCRSWGWA